MVPKIKFQWFDHLEQFEYSKDKQPHLYSTGTMMFQAIGFPKNVGGYTCIPAHTGNIWTRIGKNIQNLDYQWYREAEDLTSADVDGRNENVLNIKRHFCRRPRSYWKIFEIAKLSVGFYEIHKVTFIDKSIVFRRLGQTVSLNLQDVSDSQLFTLTVEWSENHLEIRVSWVEGEDLSEYYTGEGIIINPNNQRDSTRHFPTEVPEHIKNSFVQYKERRDFASPLVPHIFTAPIPRAGLSEIEYLFLRTIEDIEGRVYQSEPYDILYISALLRKLFIDGPPLIDQINREYRLTLGFEIIQAPLHPLLRESTFFSVQDGLDPDTSVPGLPAAVVPQETFLKTIVILVNGVEYAVRDVIKFEANVMGGVHAGHPRNEKDKALEQFNDFLQFGNLRLSLRQLLSIARVTLRGLYPLREAIVNRRTSQIDSQP